MNRMFHYARLNDNKVCVGFLKNATKLEVNEYLVSLPDENESVLYKKWQGEKGWTQETYEPSIDTILQDRINTLEEINTTLVQENTELKLALAELAESNESKITELQMAIAELAEMGV